MRRELWVLSLALIVLLPFVARAQAPQDSFLARSDVHAPVLHPHTIAVTCNQAAGAPSIQTCTPTNFVSASVAYNTSPQETTWQLTVGDSGGFSYKLAGDPAGLEAMCISGTGTDQDHGGMDWVFENSSMTQGASHLQSVNTSTGALTLVAFASNTVAPAAGFIRPCKFTIQRIATPFGTGNQFADPLGNWFWHVGGSTIQASATLTSCGSQAYCTKVIAKYGSECNADKFLEIDMKSWGVDAIDEDSTGGFVVNSGTCSNFQPLPVFQGGTTIAFSQYSGDDLDGFADYSVKAIDLAISRSSVGVGHAQGDFFCPCFSEFLTNRFGATIPGYTTLNWSNLASRYAAPSFIANTADDTDFANMADAAGYWPTRPTHRGANGREVGWIAAISPLHISYQNNSTYGSNWPMIWGDDTNYTKRLSAVAPVSCYWDSPITFAGGGAGGPSAPPCDWPDFARNWFNASLPALNASFGSSYTSFGSTETVVPAAVPGTCTNSCLGDGTTTTYTFTLNANVTPFSIHVLIVPPGGTQAAMIAGDCPDIVSQAHGNCPKFTGETSSQTALHSPLTWKSATTLPHRLSSDPYCVIDVNNNMECEIAGGQTRTSQPTWSGPGSATTDNTVTWTNYCSSVAFGPGSFVNFSAGTGQVTFVNKLQVGCQVEFAYTTGGWGAGGCGLADENGSSPCGGATVTGTMAVNLLEPPTLTNGNTYTQWQTLNDPVSHSWQMLVSPGSCVAGGIPVSNVYGTLTTDGTCQLASLGQPVNDAATPRDFGPVNASSGFGTVAEAWIEELAAQYYSVSMGLFNNLYPDQLEAWPNFDGEFSGPSHPEFYKVQVQFQPFVFHSDIEFDTSLDLLTFNRYQYITHQTGATPILFESFYASTQFPYGSTGAYPTYNTQAQKGAGYFTHVQNMLNSSSLAGGNFNVLGNDEWGMLNGAHGSEGEGNKSLADNNLDGVEDFSTASLLCSNGVGNLCGGEPGGTVNAAWAAPYGYNALTGPTGVTAADNLWLGSGPPAPTPHFKPRKKGIIFGGALLQ